MKVILIAIAALLVAACSAPQNFNYRQAPDRHAADYQTFTLKAVENARGMNMPAMVKVGRAIKHALEAKGLKYVEGDAELLVEYAVGVRNTQEVNLHYYPDGLGMRTQHDVEAATIAKMVININDVKQQRSIWLTSGSSRVDGDDKTQDEINQIFETMFTHFH